MLKKYGSVAGMLAAGMLLGGVFATGCDGGGGEPCEIDSDCSVPGETCEMGLLGGTCGCDPSAVNDQCTAADPLTVCHPDRRGCEQGCTKDDDCTNGETCDLSTSACRDPFSPGTDECSATNPCPTGQVCNVGRCEADSTGACGEMTCSTGQVCDAHGLEPKCVAECSATSCGLGEACNTATGLCETQKCTDNAACGDNGFCNKTSGKCETQRDIRECSTTTREYVDYNTNQCVATAGRLDQCAPAAKRDSSRAESAKGPTIYRAEPFKLDPRGCDGNAPLIWFFADYYSASGNANIASPYGALRLLRKADGQTKGNEGQGYMVVCKAGSQSECDGIVSNKTEGRILFSVCRASLEDDSGIAIYFGGKEGTTEYWGNTMCIDIETKYLKD